MNHTTSQKVHSDLAGDGLPQLPNEGAAAALAAITVWEDEWTVIAEGHTHKPGPIDQWDDEATAAFRSKELSRFLELSTDVARCCVAVGLDSLPLISFLRKVTAAYTSPRAKLPALPDAVRDLLALLTLKLQAGYAQATPALSARAQKHRGRGEPSDDVDVNNKIRNYLQGHPTATIREVAQKVGLSTGKVSKTNEWRLTMARRRAAKPPKRLERQAPDWKIAALSKGNDPAAKVLKDEAIWLWLYDNAREKERAALDLKTPDEKARLIEAAEAQYDDEMRSRRR